MVFTGHAIDTVAVDCFRQPCENSWADDILARYFAQAKLALVGSSPGQFCMDLFQ
jgi:hypothetical protein